MGLIADITWAVVCYRWYRKRLSETLTDVKGRPTLEAGP